MKTLDKHTPHTGEPFCILRNYSEKEFATLLHIDPTFMAIDKEAYRDNAYVRSMCQIYTAVSENTMEPINKIQRFKLADLEQALIKLSKEQPKAYSHICDIYGIDPKNKRSKKSKGANPRPHLLKLCGWGYIELFQPNVLATITKVAKKMYSSVEMSDVEKVKYAHLFFLFIFGHDAMPYDLGRFLQRTVLEQNTGEPFTRKAKMELFEKAQAEMRKQEEGSLYAAIMLNDAYQVHFKELPDEGVNIDMIKRFMDDILPMAERLRIKAFLDMLTPDEKKQFASSGLKPIEYNPDIRALKESVFPMGEWHSDVKLFFTKNDDKFNQSVQTACKKFAKEGYQFGINVRPYKYPITCTHALSKESYVPVGYLYAQKPLAIRISDVNELHMMQIYCESL